MHKKRQKYYKLIALTIILIVVLILGKPIKYAQAIDTNNQSKAPVLLDGQVLFEVANFGIFPAKERADQINQALIDTVKFSKKITIDLVKVEREITLQNTADRRHLLTVTQADVISAASPYNQAIFWKPRIQEALNKAKKERTKTYQTKALLSSFLIFVALMAIHLGLQFLRGFISRYFTQLLNQKTKLKSWHKIVIYWWQIILLGIQVGIWIFAFVYITNLFPQTRSWRYWLTSPLIHLGSKSYSSLELLLLLALTVATWFIVRFFTRVFRFYILKRTGAEQSIQDVIAILIQYIFTFLGLIILWQSWGIDVGTLAITASVLGVGIGFGLQNIANNFISGLIITLERPIKVGDLIEVNNLIGTVKNIGSRSTKILTPDRISIIIPNSKLLENQLINWNHEDSISRLRIPIGVSYNSDLRKVKAALLYAAKNHSEILRTPRPQVFFQKFNHSSLDFELLVWIKEPKKQFRIISDLNYLIAASLHYYKIEVPFPQTDVNFNASRLEQLLTAWLSYQGINPPPNKITNDFSDKIPKIINNKSADFFKFSEDKLTEIDLEKLVITMRSDNGLDIKDRRYNFNFYPACFVGSEAVCWLIETQNYQQEEAIEIGQILIEKGIIHHVIDEHPFKDGYFFYRFYMDE
ncbi:MAG: mechanosensitive ion channel [Pleurocapsa sp. MO_192.B19]|nr:mechanosensitive ion channel [Pleurocapsa sp. MO_192.B19]